MSNSSIWPIDRTLSGATISYQHIPRRNGNVLHISEIFKTGASSSDCIVSFPGHSFGKSNLSITSSDSSWNYTDESKVGLYFRKLRWLWQLKPKKILAMVISIVVDGTLTRYALLHYVYDYKAERITKSNQGTYTLLVRTGSLFFWKILLVGIVMAKLITMRKTYGSRNFSRVARRQSQVSIKPWIPFLFTKTYRLLGWAELEEYHAGSASNSLLHKLGIRRCRIVLHYENVPNPLIRL